MMHPASAIRRSRRQIIMAQVFMALAAGALVWSGTFMLSLGLDVPGYASLAASALIVLVATQVL